MNAASISSHGERNLGIKPLRLFLVRSWQINLNGNNCRHKGDRPYKVSNPHPWPGNSKAKLNFKKSAAVQPPVILVRCLGPDPDCVVVMLPTLMGS